MSQVAIAPFPVRLSGSIAGYRQDYWHISPDVDLPGIRSRGGLLCRPGRCGVWGGPDSPVAYVARSGSRPLCPVCLKRLESLLRRWPVLYPDLRSKMERFAVAGRVPRSCVPKLGYTVSLDEAILPGVPTEVHAG